MHRIVAAEQGAFFSAKKHRVAAIWRNTVVRVKKAASGAPPVFHTDPSLLIAMQEYNRILNQLQAEKYQF